MKLADSHVWRWSIRVGVPATIALLWWGTAGHDHEWSLWRHYSVQIAALNVAGSAAIIAIGYVFHSSAGRARRLAVTALSIGTALFTITLLEVPAAFFGHDYRRDFGTTTNDAWLQLSTGVNRADSDLIHVHQPHSRFLGTVSGNLAFWGIPTPNRYPVDVEYDRNGFRNSIELERADILAIGDSFVEAAEVKRAETIAERLSFHLHATTANLGQSAYGPQQELVVLERYGLPLSPKLVIWFFFGGNDLADAENYERARKHPEQLAGPGSFSSRSLTRNGLIALARLTTPNRVIASPDARFLAAKFHDAAGRDETIYFDSPEPPWTSHQWDLATATLQRARDLSHRNGADFLLVYVPRKFRVYRGYVQALPGTAVTVWTLTDLPDALNKWCRDREIDFLDSTPALREAVQRGESVYLPDDVHWNPRGHDVVAAAIARHLAIPDAPSSTP